MSRGKFIIFYPCWNDIDWIEASLSQIEYWVPDELYLCEGCWDNKYPARSTDGTREFIEEYQKNHDNVWIVDNIRDGKYRDNQVSTCKLILTLSEAKPNDWIMYNASDVFYFKYTIDMYKNLMENSSMDYPIFEIWNFWDSITKYYPHKTKQAMNLPHRVLKGTAFRDTCDITVNGKHYHESNKAMGIKVPTIAMHYEGFREPERLKQKYNVGDRQSPVKWNNGVKLKKTKVWNGDHPEFAIPVLKQKCFYEEI